MKSACSMLGEERQKEHSGGCDGEGGKQSMKIIADRKNGRMQMAETVQVRVYGREACADTQLARRVLSEQGVKYEWLDVEASPQMQEEAKLLNGGSSRVPTVVLPGGVVLVEPGESELLSALRDGDGNGQPPC